jgi:hypothetical protein
MYRADLRIPGAGLVPTDDPSIAGCREEQAVLVTYLLDGTPDVEIEQSDISSLSDAVERAIEGANAGELDGFQTTPHSLTLFAYGVDAERLWRAMELAVSEFTPRPVHVTIRYGWFGAPARTLRL